MEETASFNPVQQLNRRLYAMRNGIVADTLRRAGCPFKIIFGLNLPQLIEIAAETPKSVELAEQMWFDTVKRENMLIAPMLMPKEDMTIERARRWVSIIPSAEVADILCHRLLRHCDFALTLASEMSESDKAMDRYLAVRLMFNLVSKYPQEALKIARKEMARNDRFTSMVACSLEDEAKFILGD
ncbi:MAG: DNA alkylation repair protein [Bacteroides sp.]|nr:DNA alkylation repair protein [Bacteroides sp.]MCM1456657.1 DNA alkylation repair protein [Lachnoclostridium sp.]